MRRTFLKKIVALAVALIVLMGTLIVGVSFDCTGALANSKQRAQTSATDTVFFEDDFENYPAGSFPSSGGWELWFNGAGAEYQTIVDGPSFSPSQSFQLWGYDFWAGFAAKRFSTDLSEVGFEAYVNVPELTNSSRDSARISFTKWTSPSTSTEIGPVVFLGDGRIASGSQILGTYVTGTWYKVTYVLDRPTATYSVWIDDQLCGENLALTTSAPPATSSPAYEIEAFSLSQCYNHARVYFDNVRIFGAGTPSPPPSPPPTPPPNPPPTPVASTNMSIEPANVSNVAVGSTFKVTVNVHNVTGLFVWQTLIQFKASVLNCAELVYPSAGYIFTGKTQIPVSPIIDNVAGTAAIGASLIGSGSASGDGVLCEMTLEVIAIGESSISFSQPYGVNTFLLTGNLDLIPATLQDSLFSNDPPIGDVTGMNGVPDGVVNMRDVGLVACNFLKSIPPANPMLNLNHDGIIDMYDIGIVAHNFRP